MCFLSVKGPPDCKKCTAQISSQGTQNYLNLNANCKATGLISKPVQALLTHVDSALQTPTSIVLEAVTWAGIVTLFFAVLKLTAFFIQLLCPLLQYSSSKKSVICAIDFISN